MSLRNLSILTVCLFFISVGVYYKKNYRSSVLSSGSYYVKGLDPSEIGKISIQFQKGDKNKKEISLKRDQNIFVLTGNSSYPASTNKVNDLIYKIASIQIKKPLSPSDEKMKKWGLTEDTQKYSIEIYDLEGQKTQSFRVGKTFKKGNYIMKEGTKEVYLTDGFVTFDPSYKDYIDRFLLGQNTSPIAKVWLKSNEIIEIEQERIKSELSEKPKDTDLPKKQDHDGEKQAHKAHHKKTSEGIAFRWVKPEKKALQVKKEKLKNYILGLKKIQFSDFFSLKDEKFKKVQFNRELKIHLENNLVYHLKIGSLKDQYLVQISASVPSEKIIIRKDSDEKELQNADQALRAKVAEQDFNILRASWLYSLDKESYNQIMKKSSDFM